ncbi:MAG: cell wall hydrolase/autolysin [Symbiobacteriaceae bacterium]|jgi:N-acetylmuramoyl-L-alanine amidase|nr:cell wall hydrolase/autolysin [Symbiobacteriaceae bacterium]
MKKTLITTLILATIASTLWTLRDSRTAQALPQCPDTPPIVIDPGHGGIDGGTNVPGMLEKEVVLDIALRTKKYLDRYKVPVVLTRDTDTALGGNWDSGHLRRDLNQRIRIANHCRAGLMLSLHVNHTRNASERGMMIFYQPSRTGRDAAYLFDDILRRWPLHSRPEQPHPRKDFAVLKTKAPALLVELGFISNDQDRQLLADNAYRERLAQALSSGSAAIYQKWLKHGSP